MNVQKYLKRFKILFLFVLACGFRSPGHHDSGEQQHRADQQRGDDRSLCHAAIGRNYSSAADVGHDDVTRGVSCFNGGNCSTSAAATAAAAVPRRR